MLEIPAASKASLAEASIATILRYAGYRVTCYGIEEQCPDISYLTAEAYRALDIPEPLHWAPDRLVYSEALGTLQLAEIKYTRSWTCEVARQMMLKLERKQSAFPSTSTVILRGSARGGDDRVLGRRAAVARRSGG